ncbi:uncharacterized protein ATC70_008200 [Mucor velutinosus]|uniref:Uncharacterized protein n=1 Tax=Mucor velutinosus TaxID=708070 RepID=A0AAN7I3Q0_9FUNG|nr:hypothetical protein ATC70_008200 [Mucor velutinosus]
MPSRNATSCPSPKKLKYRVDKVVITPERRVPKKKLEVHVNETSSPEAILHASWEFISAFQFFNTFKAYFHLPKSLSIDKLEQAMMAGKDDMQQLEDEAVEEDHTMHLKRESSVLSQQSNASGASASQPARHYLANFMVHIVSPLLTQRQKTLINTDNYEQFIADVFPGFTNFADMSVLDKIKVLKSIEMAHVEISDPELISLQNGQSGQELRFAPLGSDYEGWVYWYFGDDRLYREIPLPIGRKTITISDTLEFTFELVCSTVQDWRDLVEKFKPTKRTANRELASTITALAKEMIAKLEAREEYRLRNEAKVKRARELELMPRKKSRRLEVKSDEQAKRQKALDEAREQAALEEKERQMKAKEAKLAADKDRKELQMEEIKMRKDMFGVINDFVSQGLETEADMKPLKALINSKTPEDERVHKMKGWIKLLGGTVSVELVGEPQQVQFVGQDVDTALESVLFKNTMRIYLATLLLFKLNPITLAYENTEEVHKKLVLNRYDGMDAFCQELNTAIESISDAAVREDVIHMLMTIFTLDPPQTEEVQGADTTKQDLAAANSVPDVVMEMDATATTTIATASTTGASTPSQPTPEDTTESPTALKIADPATSPPFDAISADKSAAAKDNSIKPQSPSLDLQDTIIHPTAPLAATTTDMSSSTVSVPESACLPQI